MSYSQNAPVLILKEETDTRFGVNQIVRNIEMCEKVSDILKSTLGPNGLDKMFFNGKDMLITNDGATIMKSLDIIDPAAKILLNISEAQDKDIGDGTTSVVLLSSSILKKMKKLIKENISIQVIINSLEDSLNFLLSKSHLQLVSFHRDSLSMLAETSLNSKILKRYKEHFSRIVVKTLNVKEENLSIKRVSGKSIDSTELINGVAFEKCFTYAGYEQQPKRIEHPKILVIHVELEWKSEVENSEIRISDVNEYSKVVSTEWRIITEKLERISKTGANVVLSTLPIGDYATQYFAKHKIFSAGRVPEKEAKRIIEAFGGKSISTLSLLHPSILSTQCVLFEEKEIGKTRYNLFHYALTDEEISKACTIILRGPGAEILAEVQRSLNDSLAVTRRTAGKKEIVAGGGAFEMRMSRELKELSASSHGAKKFVILALSEALEVIPFQLAKNFGHEALLTMQMLRKAHHEGLNGYGVLENGIDDTFSSFVIEPLKVKTHMMQAAISAACTILSIDATIQAPQQHHQ
ncbi:T-complex protein 1 subunit eta [Nematocida sp. LUAm3]|nr:T-complex protein 1 subunit eta [Nematocida sp. LUAm3]KAI5174564.1 T-complex protein 1 subunit eta [Nematocida sp. LUAm2]KAI5178030.1 T-complex protein 1 subunit eta [Nematocida sp. LUAm1]